MRGPPDPESESPTTGQGGRASRNGNEQHDHLTEAAPALQARSFAVGFAFGFYSGAVAALILWGVCR
jgi:hypothetical protein